MTMAKKITLKELGAMLEHVIKHMLTKEDGEKFATKEQVFSLHTQVHSIETQLRSMKHDKHETRIADLEDDAYGPGRSKHQKHVSL